MVAVEHIGLLDRCKAGDEAAWRELFTRRAGQLYHWAVLLGLAAADAEDAAQEALVIAARRIQTCAAEEAMTSWLYQIMRRVASNHRQKRWLQRWIGGGFTMDEGAFVHAQAGDRTLELTARSCLAQLPREQAEILVMREVVGLSQKDCARILGVPQGTVASRLRRAQKAFRERWGEDAPGLTGRELEETR